MIFRLKATQSSILHLRVTPEPGQAEELRRRMSAVDYSPENGFHRDLRQERHARFVGARAGRNSGG
jgi:hypothetical protein